MQTITNGGGKAPKPPKIAPTAPPARTPAAEAAQAAPMERRKAQRRQGLASTMAGNRSSIFSQFLGTSGEGRRLLG